MPVLNFRPLSPRGARIGGVLLILVGLFLVAVTGFLFAFFLDLVPIEKLMPGVYRSQGEQAIPAAAYGIVGFFTVFGLLSILQGIWQLVYGARNKVLTVVMILMGVIFMVAGFVARALSRFSS